MEIVEIIQTLGFPIACVVGLGFYVRELTNDHKNEVKELSKAIDNNTLIITKLYERFVEKEDKEWN